MSVLHSAITKHVRTILLKNEWPLPLPTRYTRPLPAEGPPFEPWVAHSKRSEKYNLVVDEFDALSMVLTRISFLTIDLPLIFPTLLMLTKRGRCCGRRKLEIFGILYFSYFGFFCFSTL